jgi:hypothetical protein
MTNSLAHQVLDWIKINQDTASPGQQLVGDTIRGDSAQTFNNALAALALLLMDERERAERILDWYAAATDEANTDPRRQNLFWNGEARGFFQNAAIRDMADARAGQAIWNRPLDGRHGVAAHRRTSSTASCTAPPATSASPTQLCQLLESWYVPQDAGGYIGSGWRKFDESLHEQDGHPEGNIDAYAVLRMCGNTSPAERVSAWLLPRLQAPDRPLDMFTWKVLAFGPEFAADLKQLGRDARLPQDPVLPGPRGHRVHRLPARPT